jgi:hypothetical protein
VIFYVHVYESKITPKFLTLIYGLIFESPTVTSRSSMCFELCGDENMMTSVFIEFEHV